MQCVVEISAVRDDMFDDRQREKQQLERYVLFFVNACFFALFNVFIPLLHGWGHVSVCVSVCLLTRLTQITTATHTDLQELIIHRGSVQGKFHEIWRFGRKFSIEGQFFHEDCKGMSRETVHRILQVSVWMPKQDGE